MTQKKQASVAPKQLLLIKLIDFFVSLYDFITLPIYYLICQPWKVEQLANKLRARLIDDFTWESVESGSNIKEDIKTLDELFRKAVHTYSNKDALGVRKILGVKYKEVKVKNTESQNKKVSTNTQQCNGIANLPETKKTVAKYILDDKYSWHTYQQVGEMVKELSAGLMNVCGSSIVQPDQSRMVIIAADTCMEWFLISHACFRNNITLATTYTTLDDEAILHSIKQTEVKVMIVSQKFSERLSKILPHAPTVDTVIMLDQPIPGVKDQKASIQELIGKTSLSKVVTYEEIRNIGRKIKNHVELKPSAEDIAVLMYTSGSTGKAKGVMLSHRSVVYTALSFIGPGDLNDTDRFIAYLPLGHVLELSAECIFFRNGGKIGYSSTLTLTSNSLLVEKGCKGDVELIKPTVVAAVPLVLDRIKLAINQAVKSQGKFYDQFINDWLVKYKRYWWDRYYSTPLLNYLICRKFNKLLGGNVRAICSGGAALSKDTHEYLRHVTNFTLIQGYGLTETSAAASFCDIHDRRYSIVGPPYPSIRIKLIDWSDYSVHDKPNPRGEIIIGGNSVCSGYYKMPKETKECFFTDEKTGVRYFRTGDIGMMLPDGVLKIIDRKKDLVKPLCGEYISLSQIENIMLTNTVVENICVYCSPHSNHIVAIVRACSQELRRIASELYDEDNELGGKFKKMIDDLPTSCLKSVDFDSSKSLDKPLNEITPSQKIKMINLETLCNSNELTQRVLQELKKVGEEKKLRKNQIPSNIKLVADEWTPENGFITASFKLRRRELEKFYASDIESLYAQIGQILSVNNS